MYICLLTKLYDYTSKGFFQIYNRFFPHSHSSTRSCHTCDGHICILVAFPRFWTYVSKGIRVEIKEYDDEAVLPGTAAGACCSATSTSSRSCSTILPSRRTPPRTHTAGRGRAVRGDLLYLKHFTFFFRIKPYIHAVFYFIFFTLIKNHPYFCSCTTNERLSYVPDR